MTDQIHGNAFPADRTLAVIAPSRIHFGLFSVSRDLPEMFGGMGTMVSQPSVEISLRASDQLRVRGLYCDLVTKHIQTWHRSFRHLIRHVGSTETIPFEITLSQCPRPHTGFGTGTQLAFSVATILFNAIGAPIPSTAEMAVAMDRGKRSAIGSYGFFDGGFLVDRGITIDTRISPLELRIPFPEDWRFVLMIPKESCGAHGQLESLSFNEITRNVVSKRAELIRLCSEEIVPAVSNVDYAGLGGPLFEFNRISGSYFKDFQDGYYHSEFCSRIVKDLQQFGLTSIGQSSWGPCIFAIAQSHEHATEIRKFLIDHSSGRYSANKIEIKITSASNQGARTTCAPGVLT